MDFSRLVTVFLFFVQTQFRKVVMAEKSTNAMGLICSHDKDLADWIRKEYDYTNQHTFPRVVKDSLEPHPGYMTYHLLRGTMKGDIKQTYDPGHGRTSTSGLKSVNGSTSKASAQAGAADLASGKPSKKRRPKKASTTTSMSTSPTTTTQAPPDEGATNSPNNTTRDAAEDGEIEYYDFEEEPNEVPDKLRLEPGKPSTEVHITQDEYVRTIINRKEQQ